jgi:hypothetical protein
MFILFLNRFSYFPVSVSFSFCPNTSHNDIVPEIYSYTRAKSSSIFLNKATEKLSCHRPLHGILNRLFCNVELNKV